LTPRAVAPEQAIELVGCREAVGAPVARQTPVGRLGDIICCCRLSVILILILLIILIIRRSR
jgi:hypothetical protein